MFLLRSVVFGLTAVNQTAHFVAEKSAAQFFTNNEFDVVIVGGGIIGCATARQLKLSLPNLRVALIEKEPELVHQTGHNSGVLHAGIYYQPGSLKAKLCVEGIDLAYEYLDQKNIPYKRCGKLIVAVEEREIPLLEALYVRAQKNGCKKIELVDSARITEIEPHCRGLKAIWSPYTGIVDWSQVTRAYADDFVKAGGKVYCNRPLKHLKLCKNGKYVVKIESAQEKVPDPSLPFLGVHFTPTIYGDVLLGPNAVLAFKREGYKFWDFSLYDFYDALSYSGMRKLLFKYAAFGLREMYRSIFISAQVKQLRRYVPELQLSDVTSGPSGVRAQALDTNGSLVDDFIFDGGEGQFAERLLHVRNAPSPGATGSLAIAKMIVSTAVEKFRL